MTADKHLELRRSVVRNLEGRTFECARARLAIQSGVQVKDDEELRRAIRLLRWALYPSRSGGIH